MKVGHQAKSAPAVLPSKSTHSPEGTVRTTPTVYQKSLSISDLMKAFSYGKVFYSILENVSVTVEAYIPGEFVKNINNDGECMACPNEGLDELFLKAQCLSHFSYEYSNNELII